MTPIGSTSSNIRRAIEFMVEPSFCNLGAPSGRSRSVGRLRIAKLIAQRSRPTLCWDLKQTQAPSGAVPPDEKLVLVHRPRTRVNRAADPALGDTGAVSSGI